jgi:hypothetical protein
VKVSGRITGAGLAGARWVRLQTLAPNAAVATPGGIGAPLQRIGEAPIRDDGTFEMLRVPPGPFTMMVLSASNPVDIIVQMRLDVGDQDMSVDFTVTPARPATGPPGPSLVVPPPAPFTVTIP